MAKDDDVELLDYLLKLIALLRKIINFGNHYYSKWRRCYRNGTYKNCSSMEIIFVWLQKI